MSYERFSIERIQSCDWLNCRRGSISRAKKWRRKKYVSRFEKEYVLAKDISMREAILVGVHIMLLQKSMTSVLRIWPENDISKQRISCVRNIAKAMSLHSREFLATFIFVSNINILHTYIVTSHIDHLSIIILLLHGRKTNA